MERIDGMIENFMDRNRSMAAAGCKVRVQALLTYRRWPRGGGLAKWREEKWYNWREEK